MIQRVRKHAFPASIVRSSLRPQQTIAWPIKELSDGTVALSKTSEWARRHGKTGPQVPMERFCASSKNRSTVGCSTINTSANTRLKLHQCLGDIMRRKGSLATLVRFERFGDASTVAFMRRTVALDCSRQHNADLVAATRETAGNVLQRLASNGADIIPFQDDSSVISLFFNRPKPILLNMGPLCIQFPLFQVTGSVTFLRGYQSWFLEPCI